MTADDIAPLFTRADGTFLCARWGRPIVPVIFGVEEETLATLKGAIEAVTRIAGVEIGETDPELGANLMVFFCRDWADLLGVPNLDRLLDDLPGLVHRLTSAGATRYQTQRYEADGTIRLCISFVRMDAAMAAQPADAIALALAAHMILSWSDRAFADRSPLAQVNGLAVLQPQIAGVIAAAYDPILPAVARDPAHAYRLAARVQV